MASSNLPTMLQSLAGKTFDRPCFDEQVITRMCFYEDGTFDFYDCRGEPGGMHISIFQRGKFELAAAGAEGGGNSTTTTTQEKKKDSFHEGQDDDDDDDDSSDNSSNFDFGTIFEREYVDLHVRLEILSDCLEDWPCPSGGSTNNTTYDAAKNVVRIVIRCCRKTKKQKKSGGGGSQRRREEGEGEESEEKKKDNNNMVVMSSTTFQPYNLTYGPRMGGTSYIWSMFGESYLKRKKKDDDGNDEGCQLPECAACRRKFKKCKKMMRAFHERLEILEKEREEQREKKK